ncbi:MAG: hypothetical protein JWQ25_2087 [Daejeonella sp.]|nr:hypothetical protein [Daejeonella sp.]
MKNFSLKVIKTGLIVGTLDILAAFIYFSIKTGQKSPVNLLKFVASGFFGKDAFTGGSSMVMAGLLFHYFNAMAFTAFFFLLFPKIRFFAKNKILTGVLLGIFVFAVMNFLVVPLSNVPPQPVNLVNSLINGLILICCIGLPLSFMVSSYYNKTQS